MSEEYMTLLHEWGLLIDAEKAAKARKAEIKEKIAIIMHQRKVNQLLLTDSEDQNWEIRYQSSNRKKVDYTVLFNQVGHDVYNQIVTETPSTSLFIRKEKVKKTKTALSNESPVDLGPNPDLVVPTGVIS